LGNGNASDFWVSARVAGSQLPFKLAGASIASAIPAQQTGHTGPILESPGFLLNSISSRASYAEFFSGNSLARPTREESRSERARTSSVVDAFYNVGLAQKEMQTLVKGTLLLVALLACAVYLAHPSSAGVRPQEEPEKKESKSISPEQLAHAKTLFNERCTRCHGADGHGATVLGGMLSVPDFTDEKWWKEDKSDRRLITSVTDGKDEMPSFGKKLSKQEIEALVAYVRRFNKAAH
jgi:cytochrome c6